MGNNITQKLKYKESVIKFSNNLKYKSKFQ